MNRQILTFVFLLCSMTRTAADSIEASDDFRASAIVADKLMVYEGLPHQMQRRDLFLRESKRKDVTKIALSKASAS
jgi:hypothetical protein